MSGSASSRRASSSTARLEGAALVLENRQARCFTIEEIVAALGGRLSDKHLMLLGKGGFGSVYKGTLPDGTHVAVKRFHPRHGEEIAIENLHAEINVLSSVSHRNLVRLLGICIDGDEHVLVYDFIPNGSLEEALFGSGADMSTKAELSWSRRRDILLGTARALLYLHHQCVHRIIHRDIKPANILLDGDWQPRLADFGLAKETLYTREEVTTILKGTPGYLAPEIWDQTTLKSDVFSFGMVLLVVTSCKAPSYDLGLVEPECPPGLLSAVLYLFENDRLMDVVDPALDPQDNEEIQRFISVALHCTQPTPSLRPSMEQLYYMLEGRVEVPQVSLEAMNRDLGPEVPGFSALPRRSFSSTGESRISKPSTSTTGASSVGMSAVVTPLQPR